MKNLSIDKVKVRHIVKLVNGLIYITGTELLDHANPIVGMATILFGFSFTELFVANNKKEN